MKNNHITSLRRYRAQRCFDGYLSLPRSQRTSARSALLLEAVFEYAYEHVPRHKVASARQIRIEPDDSRMICKRLEEFLPQSSTSDGARILSWLHENLLPEAWTYPQDMRRLMQDILRET